MFRRIDTVRRMDHIPARAMLLEEELDPEDDEDVLDPIDEYDSFLTQDDCGEDDD